MLCLCPCLDEELDLELEPVLLISGIGGSILNCRKKKKNKGKVGGFDTRIWVRILLADLEFKKKLWSLYNPLTGYTETLDRDTEIVVPDDDYGLYAIDIIDPSAFVKCIHLQDVYYFHDMIDMLLGCGYKKGTTLFGYGYDFRQSNRIDKSMEDFQVKLETAYKASGGKKVNIISHSMGGLLVTCFMSLHPEVFSKYVGRWICIGCPFQGAPGCINDSLLTGLQFVEGLESFFFVSRWSMHQLLVECPSIYEMLANPDFSWKKEPEIQVWRKQSKNGKTSIELETYCPVESNTLFREALRNNELTYDGKTVALPFNHAISRWASETRQVLNNAKLPDGVCFYNIYGISFDTPFDVRYGSKESPIEDLSEICHTLPQYSYVDGDETVYAESAKADGFFAVERVAIAARHRELISNKTVLNMSESGWEWKRRVICIPRYHPEFQIACEPVSYLLLYNPILAVRNPVYTFLMCCHHH